MFCFVVLLLLVVVETLVRSNQKAVLRQSTLPDLTTSLANCNLQFAICNLQFAISILRPISTSFDRQSTLCCNLTTSLAICNLQFAICNLQFQYYDQFRPISTGSLLLLVIVGVTTILHYCPISPCIHCIQPCPAALRAFLWAQANFERAKHRSF
jgi:ABC-type transport system involved in cytochrome c biogenesis permease subunit